jgi:hypothetical protein
MLNYPLHSVSSLQAGIVCLILVVFFSDYVHRPETVIVSVLIHVCTEFVLMHLLTEQVEVTILDLYSGRIGLESRQIYRLLCGFVVVFFSSCSLPCTYVQVKFMYSTRLYVLAYALLSGVECFQTLSL